MIKKISVVLIAILSGMCTVSEAKSFLFIGDSVTDGGWGRSGGSAIPSEKRNHTDLNHLYGHSYMMLSASYFQSKRPYADIRFVNRGISGNTLRDLESRWQKDAVDINADIVSVLIGTNDVAEFLDGRGSDTIFDYNSWKNRYKAILDVLKEKNPDIKIILGTPFAGKNMSPERKEITRRLASAVVDLARENDWMYVRYDSLFSELEKTQPRDGYWIWDGVHPTAAGHARMAELLNNKIEMSGWLKDGGDNRVTIAVDPKRLAESPEGPFKATWESLEENYRTPQWFKDAKFGIFIHWGPYAVAASGSEWYPKHMYNGLSKEHRSKWGRQSEFGYKDFIPLFKAEKFDPEEWAQLFYDAGAGYVIPTAEHHDGFAMYDSDLTEWNAVKKGPHRDVIGELAEAVRGKGMKFGVSNHRVENWDFMYPSIPQDSTDLFDAEYASLYGPPQHPTAQSGMGPGKTDEGHHPQSDAFMNEWQARVLEIIDRYHPDLLYFDNGINYRSMDPWKLAIARYYYNSAVNWNKDVSIQSKSRAYLAGSILDFERESRAPRHPYGRYWQVDDPIGHKFGYVEGLRLQDADVIIRNLIDNVACGGNLCLNISPKADGTIPDDQKEILLKIGKWLRKYGEGIYGTMPFEVNKGRGNVSDYASEPDVRLTVGKDGTLYAFLLNPDKKSIVINYLPDRDIKEIINLANGKKTKFERNKDTVKIDNTAIVEDPAICFRIEFND